MTCKKCQTLLSDDTVACPICGMPTVRRKSKQRSLLGLSVIGTDFLTLAMTLVHISFGNGGSLCHGPESGTLVCQASGVLVRSLAALA